VLNASEQSGVVTTGPWLARDGFVAETAIKMDRLQAKIDRLEHQGELVRHHMAELLDSAQQTNRFQAFEESLRNSREYKIDEMLRAVKDLKARLDLIEGTRTISNHLTYKTFESVDRKLLELGAFQARMAKLERGVAIKAVALFGSLFLAAAAAVIHFG
jgi:hypothetical protein